MKFHPNITEHIANHEGYVSRYYKDPVGVPTIGYGFTWGSKVFREWWLEKYKRKFKAGDRMTKAEALGVLEMVIDHEYAPFVEKAANGKHLKQHEAAAALDMVYNCGPGVLKWKWFKFLKLGRIKQAGDRYAITATTARGRRLPGLIRRRREGAEILEHNHWPRIASAFKKSHWRLEEDDHLQGRKWLVQLGYLKKVSNRNHKTVEVAIAKFQRDHPNLIADGILGRATLDQLQRTIDLKKKAVKTSSSGAAVGGAGLADSANDLSGYGDWLLWFGIGFVAIALAYLCWSYRDEIKTIFNSFKRK